MGDKVVKKLVINQKQEEGEKDIELDVDGIFIEIGASPVSEIVAPLNLKMDKNNYILTDKMAGTNVPGCFAAGDTSDSKLKQVVTAAGEGANAAKAAKDFLVDKE